MKMNKEDLIKKKMKDLSDQINYHDDLYYKQNKQEVSDEEYDKLRSDLLDLEKRFPKLEKDNSPNQKVGKIDIQQFETIRHNSPMLSLNNAYNKEEVKSFYEKIANTINKEFYILAETKVDGLSASLRYKNRRLKIGLTRGDGERGEEITRNLEHVEGIKKILPNDFPEDLEIRGEIFMKKNIFIELNKNRKKKGLPLFSTPRNAAAGSVRQLDPKIAKDRMLSFYGYSIIGGEKFFGNSLMDIRKILKKYNFSLNEPSAFCSDVEEMINFYNKVNDIRGSLNYDIDGIVYKLDDIKEQSKLGETSRWPRWALAHKFPAENAVTIVEDVSFQVGRTGTITPVAILKEVKIGGVKISRATLHNQDEIKRLNLSIGDIVSIQRAGDVIPKITSVIKKSKNPVDINFPEFCPSCNSRLQRLEKEAAIKCLNIYDCKEQKINSLIHFVSRNAFDISGLGDRQVRMFWEANFVKNFCDIFLLEEKVISKKIYLTEIEGFGEKSISNLLKSINASRNINFDKFIYSLGIRHVGQGIALILSRKFKNLELFCNYFLETNPVDKISGVGDVIIKSIKDYLEEELNISQIRRLEKVIKINYEKKEFNKYSDKIIVITGTFNKYSRKELEQKLIRMGATVSSSVTKKTDYLFSGEAPGSKLEKAKKLGIKIFYLLDVEKEIES
ncbi:MAG: NAD-dependent DNA ligase LigA [Pseudomonadota bacterium]|nr:NAD-dependent DNA ligase LigA [Pseudomonadota bacterium]